MEEVFTYDDTNRLTGITLKRPSGQDLYCSATYDALGRMTSKEAVARVGNVPQVTTIFSLPVFDNTKVHAMSQAQTSEGVFPSTAQTVTYTGFDKVGKVKQGTDSICYIYGYDRQRILMEERVGSLTRTKQYLGNCEYVTETDGNATASLWRTFVAGPYGVFAVVESRNGMHDTHYVLKDNLGSWTTITNESGNAEQRLSYDAWGNLRNPNTWANYTSDDSFEKPMFDRGFTGHEHLAAFGLVNMNGRMYDPVMSSFLSPDRFVQNPMTAMGFNRYAYCMNNPLRFVDPTGWEAVYGGGYPKTVSGLIQDYLSDPCYITRSQLLEAGIYDIEGGYGFYSGGGTMEAGWMEGDGSIHHTSWTVRSEGGGFQAGGWAIPCSFNPMWENHCLGLCDYGGINLDSQGFNDGVRTGSFFSGACGGNGYWSITNHYSVEKIGILPLDADISKRYGAYQSAYYRMGYNVTVSNVFDNKRHLFTNNQITISISGNSSHTLVIGDVYASAKVSLYVDDNLIESKPLTIDPQIVVLNPINTNYIGSTSFAIPNSSIISLQIQGGWRVNTGSGWVVPNATKYGPTINANKTIEINP